MHDALNMALVTRRPAGVIHHSDQGSQYTSIEFGRRCREAGVRPSTGSVGDAYDNVMCESFFATLECELLWQRRFQTQAEACNAVFEFVGPSAVCPARGIGAALVLPEINTAATNLHLAEISRCVAPGAHAVVNLDRAGWHQIGGRLQVPDNISLLPLPRYSPELNPVENVWEFLRQNYLANSVYQTYEMIVDACCDAWNVRAAASETIRSIASRAWAETVTA
ncbi:MAG: DDE-type integrase/transposase/recombinase [Acetobacteraceae bacterium]|nr:DDE-type integrase/transposase/recombinase [Acetobacteraceae bacterium]